MRISFFSTSLILCCLLTVRGISQLPIGQAGYYIIKVGDWQVTALSDGTFPLETDKLFSPSDNPKIKKTLKEEYLSSTVETSINTYLIQSGKKLILVDAGIGETLGGAIGNKLMQNMKVVGVLPQQITDILITHVHLDHAGGLLSKGRIVFPNAIVHVHKSDVDFWLAHQDPVAGEDPMIQLNRVAFLAIKPYLDSGRVKTFEGNQLLMDGITALEHPAHTPGHTAFLLERKGAKMIFWGDLIHVESVQFKDPGLRIGYDLNKNEAIIKRQTAYSIAAKEGYLVAAAHISFPGIGRVRTTGKYYRWVPLNYSIVSAE